MAMQSLARMLSGRRTFNRAEAIGLARQIEASAGENLTQLFAPGGNWRRSSPGRARVGNDIDVFKHYAIAMKWAAGELADQLEKQPSAEDIRTGLAWSPDWGRGDPYRSRGRNNSEALTREVFTAYNNLQTTCNNCHANFRTERR
jgi:cytochrome c556